MDSLQQKWALVTLSSPEMTLSRNSAENTESAEIFRFLLTPEILIEIESPLLVDERNNVMVITKSFSVKTNRKAFSLSFL